MISWLKFTLNTYIITSHHIISFSSNSHFQAPQTCLGASIPLHDLFTYSSISYLSKNIYYNILSPTYIKSYFHFSTRVVQCFTIKLSTTLSEFWVRSSWTIWPLKYWVLKHPHNLVNLGGRLRDNASFLHFKHNIKHIFKN